MRRLALRDGVLSGDADRRLEGRGAYVCDGACARRALTPDALRRAFRSDVAVPDDFVEWEFRGQEAST
jgi:predicted RNA-binding protein YlxR (DUF448 family)